MTWIELAAIAVVLLGLGAGAFLVAQRPSFWLEMGRELLASALPYIIRYVSKRDTPEHEAERIKCEARGMRWDNSAKRCVPKS